jgi:NitT/TauT family transport system substrate-binding protein
MRTSIIFCILFVSFLVVSCQVPTTVIQPATNSVSTGVSTVRVGYFPAAGRYAGFYAASDKSLYAKENLDVQFVPIYGGEDRLAALKAGQVDVILTDATDTVLAQEKGADITIVAVLQAINSLGTLSVEQTGIHTPKDYENHVFGAKPGGLELELLPIIAHLNGFDASKVSIKQLDYSALLPSLLDGSVDFVIAFSDSGAYGWTQTAAKAGKPLKLIRWADYGLDTYGDSIVVGNELLAKNPDVVRRFVTASMQGFVYAANHQAEVPEIVMKSLPTELPEEIEQDWLRGLANLSDEATKEHGLGWIDSEKFKRTKERALQAYNQSSTMPDANMFTNEFIPGPTVNLPNQ